LAPKMGVHGLAWGVVIGALLYLILQVPSLLKQKGAYTVNLGFNDPAVQRIIQLMGPRLLGVGIVQLNFWVNTWLASQMTAGSMTGLYFGFSLMLMAQAAIAQSVAIAAMPTFSAQHALGRVDEMRSSLAAALRGVILLAVPASVGLILLREPLVSLLYQRGEFDERSVELVAWALLWFAVGLVGHSIMEILTRVFYAQHDTRTPVIIGTVAMGLNVLFSFALASLFEQNGWMPHGGLALANSLATALEATILFIVIRSRLNGIQGVQVLRGSFAALVAAGGMGAGLMAWLQVTDGASRWISVPGGVILGSLIYAVGIWLVKVPEIRWLAQALSRRLKRT
jgi:putative peptidoglycan lipid II flippase